MKSDRHLPKKYRQDSRSHRLRNRNRNILLSVIALITLAAAGFFFYLWLTGRIL